MHIAGHLVSGAQQMTECRPMLECLYALMRMKVGPYSMSVHIMCMYISMELYERHL